MTLKFAYPKHILLNFLVEHVLMCVNPCGGCVFVAQFLKLQRFPKKSQNDSFKICHGEMI